MLVALVALVVLVLVALRMYSCKRQCGVADGLKVSRSTVIGGVERGMPRGGTPVSVGLGWPSAGPTRTSVWDDAHSDIEWAPAHVKALPAPIQCLTAFFPFFCVHVPVCLAVFFVRLPRSACHVERTSSLMGHIQTKDRLHMGNNTLRHLAMTHYDPLQTIRMVKVINLAHQCCACRLLHVSSICHRSVGTHMCR